MPNTETSRFAFCGGTYVTNVRCSAASAAAKFRRKMLVMRV